MSRTWIKVMTFNLKSLLTQLVIFFSSIAVTIILFNDPTLPPTRNFLPFLPMVFTFGCIVFINIYSYIYKNIAITIIVFTYYVRLVITPFFMKFSNYQRSEIVANVDNTFNTAITLMIFEYFLVFLILSLFGGKFCLAAKNVEVSKKLELPDKSYKSARLLLIFLSLFIIACVLLYPDILNNYKFFVFLSEEQSINWYRNYNLAKETVPIFIFYISTWAINIVKNIWILVLILNLRKRGAKKINLFISITIIILNALISSGDTAYSLYFSLAFLIVLTYLYPNRKRIIILFTSLLILIVAVLGLLSLSLASSENSSGAFFNISNTLQAYFNGPVNVAAALMVNKVNTYSLILADFFTSLPLLRTFFTHMINSTGVFNEVMYGSNGTGGQILPSVGLGKLYFGFILAPLFSCIFTYQSMRYGSKFSQETRLPYKFLYQFISIILACIPVLYNYYIFLIGLFTYILPTWIIIVFMTKRITYKS